MLPREPGRPIAGACLGERHNLTTLSRIGFVAPRAGRPAQPVLPAPVAAQATGLRGGDTAVAEQIRMAQTGAAQDRSVARSAAPQDRKGHQEVAGWSILGETEAGPTGCPWGPWARTQIGRALI